MSPPLPYAHRHARFDELYAQARDPPCAISRGRKPGRRRSLNAALVAQIKTARPTTPLRKSSVIPVTVFRFGTK